MLRDKFEESSIEKYVLHRIIIHLSTYISYEFHLWLIWDDKVDISSDQNYIYDSLHYQGRHLPPK